MNEHEQCMSCLAEGKYSLGTHKVLIASVPVSLCELHYQQFVDSTIMMEDFQNEEYQD